MPGEHVRVSVRGDLGDDPHEDVLRTSRRHVGLEAVEVVGVVDDDQPDSRRDGQGDLVIELGVAVEHEGGRVGTAPRVR